MVHTSTSAKLQLHVVFIGLGRENQSGTARPKCIFSGTPMPRTPRHKNRCLHGHFFSVAIDPILFKLAGNKDMHNILDEFEFRLDRTTDYRAICP